MRDRAELVAVEDEMILIGDSRDQLKTLPDASVQCCVTSPPYWGLRDYGVEGQLGLEPTPDAYVQKMVQVFREVRRVLKDDGTLWLNLGDSYAGSGKGPSNILSQAVWDSQPNRNGAQARSGAPTDWIAVPTGLKPKDLVGIPWRVAFALQADGWYLRSDIIWAKPNPMPESVTDRPTKSHEYIFLLTKSERYYYDHEAIKEQSSMESLARYERGRSDDHKWADGGPGNQSIAKSFNGMKAKVDKQRGHSRRHAGFNDRWDSMTKEEQCSIGRNKRSVWYVPTQPYAEAHFATFPPKLIEPCILAGSKLGDIVLDPFAGSGTTLYVAKELGRQFIGIELNEAYIELIKARLRQEVLAL